MPSADSDSPSIDALLRAVSGDHSFVDQQISTPDRLLRAFAQRQPPEEKKKWDTSILSEREVPLVTNPGNRYFLEAQTPSAVEVYEEFIRTQDALGTRIDHGSSVAYASVREALDWVLVRAGYASGHFELDIIRSDEANAFIIHHEAIPKPHIFITTGFLRDLAEKLPHGLRAGHLRFILGHEVAHFKEGHYEQAKPREREPAPGEDPITIRPLWGNVNLEFAKEHFLQLAFTRDQELIADKHSIIWSATALGHGEKVNPVEGVEVLDYLARRAEEYKKKRNDEFSPTSEKYPLLSWCGRTISSTHPGSHGRAARGRGVVRQIEVERSGESAPSATRRLWKDTARVADVHRDSSLSPTPLQRMLGDFDALLNPGKDRPKPELAQIENFIRDRIANYRPDNFQQALDEIRHLAVIIPAYIRIQERCVPLQPYDQLVSVGSDDPRAVLTAGLKDESAQALKRIMCMFRDCVTGLLERVPAQADCRTRADAALGAYFALGGMYRAYGDETAQSGWGERLLFNEALAALKQDPRSAAALIERHGRQYFDFRSISCEWLRPLLAGPEPEVIKRGEWFSLLIEGERLDQRADLFKTLLSNGLLEEIGDLDSLIGFVEESERIFSADPQWSAGEMAQTLGGEVSLWVSSQFESANPLDASEVTQVLEAIQSRKSVASGAVDHVLIETCRPLLSPESGTLEKRVEWLTRTFEPGADRDLLLCALIEEEAHFFDGLKEIYHPDFRRLSPVETDKKGDKIRRTDKELALERRADNELPHPGDEVTYGKASHLHRYCETILPLLKYFDCRWVDLQLRRGNMAMVDGVPPGAGREDTAVGEWMLSQMPLHSALLYHFSKADYYDLKAPHTREMNTLRYYLRPFIELSVLLLHYRDPSLPDTIGGLDLLAFAEELTQSDDFDAVPRTVSELHRSLAYGALYKLAVDMPAETKFLYYDPLSIDLSACNVDEDGESQWDYPEMLSEHQATAESQLNIQASALEGETGLNSYIRALWLKPGDDGIAPDADEYIDQVASLPPGEFRDYLVLRALAYCVESACLDMAEQTLCARRQSAESTSVLKMRDAITSLKLSKGERFKPPAEHSHLTLTTVKSALALLRSPETIGPQTGAKISSMSTELAFQLDVIAKVYRDFSLYLRFRSGVLASDSASTPGEISFFNLPDVATELGKMALLRFHGEDRKAAAAFTALTPGEKLAEIESLFIYSSAERDSHLMRILEQAESDSSACYREEFAARVYNLLLSPFYRAAVGEKIYLAKREAEPLIAADFDRHLELILDTHPAGSARLERRLKHFYDGKRGSEAAAVRTWAQCDRVRELLARAHETTADQDRVVHKGGIQFIEAAINEIDLPPQERVETVLWMAGLRGKSHLVNCYEAVTGSDTSQLDNELQKLTDDEKKGLISTVLVGPHGILKSEDAVSKKEFLDTLFFAVFRDASDQRTAANVRYFKAVYDTMLHHIEPERAAEFLGNFLVAHLEGQSFNRQVKVFFESFGFVGVKTAQYLVSSTTMIPDDMKEVLMDLTSRVEGPNKDFVFELAERTYGPDARKIIAEIGEWVGGGSLMSFYEVTLTDGRKGVIGVLRPDIVNALPEDIVLVHRLIETMQEAPEIFGGHTVSMDLNENLVFMSLVETNLQRTGKLQARMKREIEQVDGDVSVRVPEVWTHIRLDDEHGGTRRVALTRGPFIFMEKAQGLTLDLYMKSCAERGEHGAGMQKRVLNKIADVFLDQLTKHGLVHCDLHPGNILVLEENGKIAITFLDIGLSVELKDEVRQPLERYLRIAVGSTDLGEGDGAVGRAVRRFFGVGEVDEKKGKRWIRESVDLFEQLVAEQWSDDLRKRASEMLWNLASERETSVQKKLSQIMELSRELGLHFPREFYYILRAVSVMGYVWGSVDWKRQAGRFRGLGEGDARIEFAPIDTEEICSRIMDAAERVDITLEGARVREIVESIESAEELGKRIELLRGGLTELGRHDEDKMHELVCLLTDDDEFRDQIGLGEAARKLQQFFTLQRGEHARSNQDFGFLAAEPLPPGSAREIAYERRFGQLSPVWKNHFHPGMAMQIVKGEKKFVNGYVVMDYNRVHQPPEDLEIGTFADSAAFEDFATFSRVVFMADRKPEKGLVSDWQNLLLSMERYRDRMTEARGRGKRSLLKEQGLDITQMIPWMLYANYFGMLSNPELNRNLTTLEKMGKSCANTSSMRIQVMLEGKWIDLDDCLLQEGESAREYLRVMTEKRRELGLVPQ